MSSVLARNFVEMSKLRNINILKDDQPFSKTCTNIFNTLNNIYCRYWFKVYSGRIWRRFMCDFYSILKHFWEVPYVLVMNWLSFLWKYPHYERTVTLWKFNLFAQTFFFAWKFKTRTVIFWKHFVVTTFVGSVREANIILTIFKVTVPKWGVFTKMIPDISPTNVYGPSAESTSWRRKWSTEYVLQWFVRWYFRPISTACIKMRKKI